MKPWPLSRPIILLLCARRSLHCFLQEEEKNFIVGTSLCPHPKSGFGRTEQAQPLSPVIALASKPGGDLSRAHAKRRHLNDALKYLIPEFVLRVV